MDLQNNMLSPLNALADKDNSSLGAALVGHKGSTVGVALTNIEATNTALAESLTDVETANTVLATSLTETDTEVAALAVVANKYGAEQQLPLLPSRNKLFWRNSADQYYLITPKAGDKGYVLVVMERGIVTGTQSIGDDAGLLRVTGVLDLLDAWGGKHTPFASSGSWDESAYNYPNAVASFGLNDAGKWWKNSGGVGAWSEWVTTILDDGEFNVKFYTSANSSSDVDISIDGVVIDTISLVNADGGLYTYKGKCVPGTRTIRVTNKTTDFVYVFGVNYYSIKDHPTGRTPEAVTYWRTAAPYITNKGASDYAIYNHNDNLWGGSYHGGETLITERMLFDGELKAYSVGALSVFNELVIEQQTAILWPTSGDNFTVDTAHHFGMDAGYTFRAVFDGNADVETFYTAMSTTDSSFTDVKFPVNHRFTGVGGDLPVGRNSVICQRDPASHNSLWNKFTLFNNDKDNTRQNGAFISEAVGVYNKLYYGAIVEKSTGVNVKGMAFSVQKVFN